ncbi:MSMEG_1061 family FMN-dependent PPOX-type flavoprotein [Vibrio mimicus]|nr:MSMEG_1061 family FMN-dependent PPOX-type flavoprotein [Vibrio mimicus]MBY7675911.1 pyridoxamine 5'-phosphate oxidase family protein [Vibrio mimicus]MBY7727771.1 pyridoxamine 5'-phosphate oxidase family protein [Vibrio mimicus]TXY13340.1 pyridoxamine 5'-phosphate oxidase family protein [Vibrio mimicus]TXY25188.1 pyridoxamine 5'-phosphate oxidase family protein [Vibrio mimicus]TXY28860.1 pyridoxamine 5'-phosphate oxidase family protein [Vibrio mimicus]
MSQITTLEQLREIYSMPAPLVTTKDVYHIDKHTKKFIETSTLFFLASQNSDGFFDISPRGGEAGFVKVLDDKTLAFPDSPGNNRLDTLTNVLANPNVGMLFVVPGIEDVARIKGKASLHIDESSREQCLDGKTKPKLVVKIEVESLLFHCPKALMLSKIWDSAAHNERSFLPPLLSIIKDQQAEKQARNQN